MLQIYFLLEWPKRLLCHCYMCYEGSYCVYLKLYFAIGRGPYWSDLSEDVENLLELFDGALKAINENGVDWVLETVEHDIAEKVSKGKTSLVMFTNQHTSLYINLQIK